MKSNWRLIAELLAAASVVVSLLFVGYELRLARDVASTENLNASLGNNLSMGTLITDNYDVWQKGCIGEQLTDGESILFAQLVQSYNSWTFIRWRNSAGGISRLNNIQPPLEVALNMHRFPGFKDTWELTQSEQAASHPIRLSQAPGSSLTAEVRRLLKMLIETEPNPIRDIRLCGI